VRSVAGDAVRSLATGAGSYACAAAPVRLRKRAVPFRHGTCSPRPLGCALWREWGREDGRIAGMSARFDCTVVAERSAGITVAAAALGKGELAVLPTDTVYGLAADAFTPDAVTALLAAKGRGRQMPPPVLVGSRRAAFALVEDVSSSASDLIDEFWPGGLTLVFRSSRSLAWDLGDTKGTVAVRMPLHPVALDLLKETGPLAVSSANLSGSPPATTAAEAEKQLGDAVSVYLDGGPCPGDIASTIVDVTGPVPRLLRLGVISIQRLRNVVALIADDEHEEEEGV
jgi:L-threonylcarbamoyladenylate synthase